MRPVLFPYGTSAIDDDVRERYCELAPWLAQDYPLSAELPHPHPVLQMLGGIYPLEDALPPWWPAFLSHCQQQHPCIAPLLAALSCQEFRAGVIDDQRWRSYKKEHKVGCPLLQQGALCQLPRKPRLATLFTDTSWEILFQTRGAAQTPPCWDLVISSAPESFLNMSNGNEWKSCMNLHTGSMTRKLPGNFYDTGVTLAALVPRGASLWEPEVLLCRTTLRIVEERESHSPLIVIGRTYHNNWTAAQLFLRAIGHLLHRHHLDWGCIEGTQTQTDFQHSYMGSDIEKLNSCDIRSFPCWLPVGWSWPYLDGDIHWGHERSGCWNVFQGKATRYRFS